MRIPRSVVLLPHLHEICSELTIASQWTLLDREVFALPNPPLYLASSARPVAPAAVARCASIPRLRGLVNERNLLDFLDVPSTQAAARAVVAGECQFCITNEDGCRRYGLTVDAELKRMTVFWMPFVHRFNG
jgi:hypothetical protein